MKRSALTFSALAMACAMAVATSAPVNAASDEAHHPAHLQRVAHRHMIPASAEALSPSMLAPARRDDDSDGLTRNTSECNRGCIDN
jgi:hypothetical protein